MYNNHLFLAHFGASKVYPLCGSRQEIEQQVTPNLERKTSGRRHPSFRPQSPDSFSIVRLSAIVISCARVNKRVDFAVATTAIDID